MNDILDIPLYEPKNAKEFSILMRELLNKKNGLYFVRLGKDES